jgi:outer membrane receptor protein involved in Fe transport
LAEKSVISFSTGFNIRSQDEQELLNINQFTSSYAPIFLSNRINSEDGSGNSYDLNVDFSQKFKKPKEELTVSLGFSEGTNDNLQIYNTVTYDGAGALVTTVPNVERTDRDNFNRNYNAQLDYTLPVGKAGKIEAGLRSQVRISESSTNAELINQLNGQFAFNYKLSNEFNNKDQVHAAYFNYQNQLKNFGYQVGLRAEDASLTTRLGAYDIQNNLSYVPGKVAYTRIYPSIFLTQRLKGEQQLQLSYSRRVNRPRGWDTNPFLDVSDPLVYRQGNPNLKAEDVHAFELSYSKFFKKWSLISTAYLRQTNDVIQRIRTEPDANGITIVTPQNLTKNVASGLELIGKFDPYKTWNFTANINLYQSKIVGVPAFGIVENSGFSYNANITNNFVLPYGITFQLRGEYRSKEVMAQGSRKAMYGLDAGAKYDVSKKASLSLNVRDVFATRKWQMTTGGTTSITDFSRQMQGTMASLTFSYRFGKTDFNFKKTKKSDEQNNRPDEESF